MEGRFQGQACQGETVDGFVLCNCFMDCNYLPSWLSDMVYPNQSGGAFYSQILNAQHHCNFYLPLEILHENSSVRALITVLLHSALHILAYDTYHAWFY